MYECALHLNYTPRTKSRTYESKNVQIIGIWKLNLLIHSPNRSMLMIFCYELKLEFSIILLWQCNFRRSFFEFKLKLIHLNNWARKRHLIFLLSVHIFSV